MPSVWLMKSAEGTNDRYYDILSANQFDVRTIPTLTFNYINNEAIREALEKPGNIQRKSYLFE